jgi:hypothetical protein
LVANERRVAHYDIDGRHLPARETEEIRPNQCLGSYPELVLKLLCDTAVYMRVEFDASDLGIGKPALAQEPLTGGAKEHAPSEARVHDRFAPGTDSPPNEELRNLSVRIEGAQGFRAVGAGLARGLGHQRSLHSSVCERMDSGVNPVIVERQLAEFSLH